MSADRASLQAEYKELIQGAKENDMVSTSLNTSSTWLKKNGFFKDMSQDNDITYYVVGRGKKGGEERVCEEQSKERSERRKGG